MAVKGIFWFPESERDIHVLAGQQTRRLDDSLKIFGDMAPDGVSAPNYLLLDPNVTLTFNALFKGAPQALGLHVDTQTGQVTVDANLPTPRKNNFIIEVTVADPSGPFSATETVRVHVHQSVQSVALTPPMLTVRPSALPVANPETTNYRFTVRATFDDGTMGDLTTDHSVTWSPDTNVNGFGRIIIAPANNAGDALNITATLPPELGGKTAQAKVTVGTPWSDEPAMPSAGIIPGGGWPGTTLPEQAPNILLMCDGFLGSDDSAFEQIAAQMVEFVKTDTVVRPYDLLCTSMNFWCVSMPAADRGISIRCEVYPLDSKNVWRVPLAVKPPASGNWGAIHLIYAAGLPVPADMSPAKSPAALRSEWSTLLPAPIPANAVSDDLIADWQKRGKRGFVDEIDGFPGLSYGQPPAANYNSDVPLLDLHDGRVGRSGMNSFFNALQSDDNVSIGASNLGTIWAAARGTFPFDNADLIVILSAYPGGRPANYTGYVAMATKTGNFPIPATPVAGGSNFQAQFAAPPSSVDEDASRTMAHELGHSFGLGDEYVDSNTVFPGTSSDLTNFANLQFLDYPASAGSPPIDGSLIRWNWRRARKAAVVSGAPASGSAPGSFSIPVVLGHELQFQPGDVLLLRLRTPGKMIESSDQVTELELDKALQVLSRGDSAVVVTGTAGSAVSLADLQPFTPGSTLYMPVPVPADTPQPTGTYARMVAKNVENLITSSNKPLYIRPPNQIRDESVQHPKLDGLAPSLPGRPFCFKAKPSIIGLYEGGATYAHKVFHPAGAHCTMRTNLTSGSPFCAVCRFIMVELIDPFKHFEIDRDYDDIYPLR
jgi:hypothetical protein